MNYNMFKEEKHKIFVFLTTSAYRPHSVMQSVGLNL